MMLPPPTRALLSPRRWSPPIREKLERMVVRYGYTGPDWSAEPPPLAAFDWDNTCIGGDLGEAVMVAMDHRDDGHRLETYNHLISTSGKIPAYRFCASVLAGRTERQVRDLVHEVIRDGLERGTLHEREEIRELMWAMHRHGWDVWVVSASAEPIVQTMAQRYGLPAHRIVGMKLPVAPDGTFGSQVLDPFTYRQGKVDALMQYAGRAPVFAAGDADTDIEMLIRATHRLVIDRGYQELSSMAREHKWWIQGGWGNHARQATHTADHPPVPPSAPPAPFTGQPTTGLAVLNFGGPRESSELTPFLTALFREVLPLPAPLSRWVAPLLARRRSRLVEPQYRRIGWSPLVATTLEQIDQLRARLPDLPIAPGMMFSAPDLRSTVTSLQREGVERIIALGLFPHYSYSTAGSAYALLRQATKALGFEGEIHWVPPFFDHPRYIDALAATVRRGAEALPGEGPVWLLFSPHGLPVSYVRRGDPYPRQVLATIRGVLQRLSWTDPWRLGWQSRVGPVRWLEPSTLHAIERIAKEGAQRVLVVPISFVGDHIETLYELDVELGRHATSVGIEHFGRCPTLGLEPGFIETLEEQVLHAYDHFDEVACPSCGERVDDVLSTMKHCPYCGFETPSHLRRH